MVYSFTKFITVPYLRIIILIENIFEISHGLICENPCNRWLY
jgi:hypothetical protein